MVLILVFLAVVLPGCSIFQPIVESATGGVNNLLGGEDNSVPPNELVEFEPELEIDVLWDHQIGIGYGEQSVNLLPAISDGVI